MKNQNNWQLIKKTRIRDMNITVLEYEHQVFKCPYIHIESGIKENVFVAAFNTLPADSTGLPHILEHSVLAGSKKYPIKDPFFSMYNRSISTFMNAFTARNWTAYPFATQNKADFYNLLSVFLDAMFFPELSELTFCQEGFRVELEDNKPVYKGVVFNEMKGVYSDVRNIMEESILKSLFPNTAYCFDSGGDPREIVKLKYADFISFHKRFYHPSNAYFYSFGSFDVNRHQRFIENEVMGKFKPQAKIKNRIVQKNLNKIQRYEYPAPPQNNKDNKLQISIGWRLSKIDKAEKVLAWEIINEILLNDEFGILKKELISSGLGTDLADGSEYNCDLWQAYFMCGLKGVEPKDRVKAEKLIINTLRKIVKNGFDKKIIDTAVNKLTMEHKEVKSAPYPYGLNIWLRLASPLLYGAPVVEAINFSQTFNKIKNKLYKEKYLEKLLLKNTVDNKNRTLLLLKPDKDYLPGIEKDLDARLAKIKKSLTRSEEDKINARSIRLHERQNSFDDPQVLPKVKIDELDKKNKALRTRQANKRLIQYKIANNRLFDLIKVFNAKIEEKDIEKLPLLTYAFQRLGIKGKDHEQWTMNFNSMIGNFDISPYIYKKINSKAIQLLLIAQINALGKNYFKAFGLMNGLIDNLQLDNKKLWQQILSEYSERLQAGILQAGHLVAAARASSKLSPKQAIKEKLEGMSQLLFLTKLKKSENLPKIMKPVYESIDPSVFPAAVISNKPLKPLSESLLSDKCSKGKPLKQAFRPKPKNKELFVFNTAVSYTAAAISVNVDSLKERAGLMAAAKLLQAKYLHPKIREKGGAYGAKAFYNSLDNIFVMASYRDPHLMNTLDIYSGAKNYLLKGAYNKNEVEDAIIKVIAEWDKPGGPANDMRIDYIWNLIGFDAKKRDQLRKSVLAVKEQDIVNIAQKHLKANWQDYSVAAITNEGKAKKREGKGFEVVEI